VVICFHFIAIESVSAIACDHSAFVFEHHIANQHLRLDLADVFNTIGREVDHFTSLGSCAGLLGTHVHCKKSQQAKYVKVPGHCAKRTKIQPISGI
jgi:hypothetical protein